MSNMVSDVSLWVFVACGVGFLAGIALTVKSYRDAKYASYFFLREEAALRVKRLLFVLIPLAIVIVFLGLRLFGPNGTGPILTAGPSAGSPTRAATASISRTPKPIQTGAATPATISLVASPAVTVTAALGSSAASPTVPAAPATNTPAPATAAPVTSSPMTAPPATANTTTTTVPAVAGTMTVPAGPGGTPPSAATTNGTATVATTPISATVDVTATTGLTTAASPTVTDTPVVGKATPRDDVVLGSIVLSRGIGPNKTPLQPSSTFSTSDSYIYVFYEFHNMTNGVAWSHRWFRGGSEVGSVSSLWSWGSDGRGYLFFSPSAGPGPYEIRLYIGEKIMASAPFQVQ